VGYQWATRRRPSPRQGPCASFMWQHGAFQPKRSGPSYSPRYTFLAPALDPFNGIHHLGAGEILLGAHAEAVEQGIACRP
jgi:hypothetical protein